MPMRSSQSRGVSQRAVASWQVLEVQSARGCQSRLRLPARGCPRIEPQPEIRGWLGSHIISVIAGVMGADQTTPTVSGSGNCFRVLTATEAAIRLMREAIASSLCTIQCCWGGLV